MLYSKDTSKDRETYSWFVVTHLHAVSTQQSLFLLSGLWLSIAGKDFSVFSKANTKYKLKQNECVLHEETSASSLSSGNGQWKPGGSSLQRLPGLFIEWPNKQLFQPRNPVGGLTSWSLTSLFYNRRNLWPIAYFKNSFKAAGNGFWPHPSLSGKVHCSQATQIHSCNEREPLDKQLLGFPLFGHTNWCALGITVLSWWFHNWKRSKYLFNSANELPGAGVRRTNRKDWP